MRNLDASGYSPMPVPFFKTLQEELLQQEALLQQKEVQQANRFPVEIFPAAVQEVIRATNKDLNFPVDFVAGSILGATSIAIGCTHRLLVKRGWEESAVLYLALVGPPGTNKSHPLSFALKPIEGRDRASYRAYEQQLLLYEESQQLGKKERQQQESVSKPVWQKVLLSDFTPEALTLVHQANKRGVGVYADELRSWFGNFNRYHSGSEQEFWLSAWSSKPLSVDRKTSSSLYLPSPFITVVGSIQNGLLTELARHNRVENGFLDRVLFVIPRDLKRHYWRESELAPATTETWSYILEQLLDLPLELDKHRNPHPQLLTLSEAAKAGYQVWNRQNVDRINEADRLQLAGAYSKLDAYVFRFSLILQLLHWAAGERDKTVVDAETMHGAIRLTEYFRHTAEFVHELLTDPRPLHHLPANRRELYESLPELFSTDDGMRRAAELAVAERTFKRFLNNKDLFQRISHGVYRKQF